MLCMELHNNLGNNLLVFLINFVQIAEIDAHEQYFSFKYTVMTSLANIFLFMCITVGIYLSTMLCFKLEVNLH